MYSDGDRVVQQRGNRTAGGAYAEYGVVAGQTDVAGTIKFQSAPITDVGVSGWTNECLLAIIEDRLTDFQSNFPCLENHIALEACKAARLALEYRTLLRRKRGVEGKNVI